MTVLADLATPESPRVAEHHEVLALIERSRLWTLDARLARVARELGVAA